MKRALEGCNTDQDACQRKGSRWRRRIAGTGPALVMVHPLKVNDTEADKKAILTITVG